MARYLILTMVPWCPSTDHVTWLSGVGKEVRGLKVRRAFLADVNYRNRYHRAYIVRPMFEVLVARDTRRFHVATDSTLQGRYRS